MSQIFSSGQVACRPASERDLEEIREFCKTIWDGHDYVPDVIDEWLQDPRGIFAVAEHEGRAIACSKITWLAEGQWWLEGFRVDPEYQGRRVGSLIHRYVDEWWLKHGKGALRLMTSSKNKSVHHLCESTGFRKLFEARGYKAEPLHGPVDTFTAVPLDEYQLEQVIEFARTSPSLAVTDCVADFSWRFADPTRGRALTDLLALFPGDDRNAFWWKKDKGLLVIWDDFDLDREEHTMGIGVAACALDDLPALLMDVRHLAAAQRKTSVFWIAPVHAHVELSLQQAGYSSDWDNSAYVFEKKHPYGNGTAILP